MNASPFVNLNKEYAIPLTIESRPMALLAGIFGCAEIALIVATQKLG